MLEAFAVPIGFHGSEQQTGGFLHYEFNQSLFMFNPFSKHNKEASMACGMPIFYPDTAVGDTVFPWRFGAENLPPSELEAPLRMYQTPSRLPPSPCFDLL